MIRRPPRSTRTDTLFPSTTLFRSRRQSISLFDRLAKRRDFGLAFGLFEGFDNLPLLLGGHIEPARTEARLRRHDRGDLVALELGAILAFLVEARVGIELQPPAKAFELRRFARLKLAQQRVALLPLQPPGLFSGAGHPPPRSF